MATTSTAKQLKQQHGQQIIAKLDELAGLINAENELWFGGLPPVLSQIANNTEWQKQQVRDALELPTPEPAAAPQTPAA